MRAHGPRHGCPFQSAAEGCVRWVDSRWQLANHPYPCPVRPAAGERREPVTAYRSWPRCCQELSKRREAGPGGVATRPAMQQSPATAANRPPVPPFKRRPFGVGEELFEITPKARPPALVQIAGATDRWSRACCCEAAEGSNAVPDKPAKCLPLGGSWCRLRPVADGNGGFPFHAGRVALQEAPAQRVGIARAGRRCPRTPPMLKFKALRQVGCCGTMIRCSRMFVLVFSWTWIPLNFKGDVPVLVGEVEQILRFCLSCF